MVNADFQRELLMLIDLQIDSEISNQQIERLAEMLRSSAETRQIYQSYFEMQADLFWSERGDVEVNFSPQATMLIIDQINTNPTQLTTEFEPAGNINTSSSAIIGSSAITGFLSSCYSSVASKTGSQFGMSISVALLSMISLIFTLALIYPKVSRPRGAGDELAQANSQQIARISYREDCVWGKSNLDRHSKSTVFSGDHFSLKQGMVEIIMHNDVRLNLHAPAELTISDLEHSKLDQGFLEIQVPKGSEGYTVSTSAATVVDLGTKFIVGADEDGSTDIQVLKGMVEVQPTAKSQRHNIRQIKVNESVRIVTAGTFTTIPAIVDEKNSKTRYKYGKIAIVNPSFELPILKVNRGGIPEGWTTIAADPKAPAPNACRRPKINEFSTRLPHGLQCGYVFWGRTLQQTLEHQLLENREYTFAVSLSLRNDAGNTPLDYQIELLADDEVIVADKGSLISSITRGHWQRLRLKFQIKKGDKFVGKKLTIRFKSTQPNSSQTTIDDVVLFVKKINN